MRGKRGKFTGCSRIWGGIGRAPVRFVLAFSFCCLYLGGKAMRTDKSARYVGAVLFSNGHTLDQYGLERGNYHWPRVGYFPVYSAGLVELRVVRVPAVQRSCQGWGEGTCGREDVISGSLSVCRQ